VLGEAAALVAPALERAVAGLSAELQAPVQHHLAGGGKRTRAALVLVSTAAAGAPYEVGLDGAVAVELVHNFSLVHDDIIDEDRERRHRSTVWAEFGVGRAIIAGDALATRSLQVLLDPPSPERVQAAAMVAAATQDMIAGQAEDMAFESRSRITLDECLRMEAGKTGALLACSSALGAVLAGAPAGVVEGLGAFGRHLGVAFQAVDDDLGIWGEPGRTGKPVGNDLVQRKKSLPVAAAMSASVAVAERIEALFAGPMGADDVAEVTHLIEECGARRVCQEMAADRLTRALASIAGLDLAVGARADLEAIATFVVGRDR
jgi:geranylgeranyl diphosphate synthase, type I